MPVWFIPQLISLIFSGNLIAIGLKIFEIFKPKSSFGLISQLYTKPDLIYPNWEPPHDIQETLQSINKGLIE